MTREMSLGALVAVFLMLAFGAGVATGLIISPDYQVVHLKPWGKR